MVANVPDYCTDEVADHTMALLLGLARQISAGDRLVRSGGWGWITSARSGGSAAGPLASWVSARPAGRWRTGRGFGLHVVAYDPVAPPVGEGVTVADSLPSLLRAADFLSLHVPLRRETSRLIDERALALMKPGAILINTSRGGLVDLDALLRALDQGTLAAAGLDVYPEEPPPPLRWTALTCCSRRTRPITR